MTTDDTTRDTTSGGEVPAGDPGDELGSLADLTAHEASAFLTAVTEVASGNSPDTAIPLLTLALSQVLVAGSRLGAATSGATGDEPSEQLVSASDSAMRTALTWMRADFMVVPCAIGVCLTFCAVSM